MAEIATRTTIADELGPNGWSIRDEVTQLREWGTDVVYPLPPRHAESVIGSSRDCWLRLWDPAGSVSRGHALLTYGAGGWTIADLGSKNGIFLDGSRVPRLAVVAGAEIRIGSVTLVAESPKLIALRALLERLLGWADERREVVDQALFSLRIAATHREPLLICGEGNLVPIAKLLHQRALEGRPFV
ncbi:MAG: FHA domain-containing protein, partial [Kofleriaceae bacterium]